MPSTLVVLWILGIGGGGKVVMGKELGVAKGRE